MVGMVGVCQCYQFLILRKFHVPYPSHDFDAHAKTTSWSARSSPYSRPGFRENCEPPRRRFIPGLWPTAGPYIVHSLSSYPASLSSGLILLVCQAQSFVFSFARTRWPFLPQSPTGVRNTNPSAGNAPHFDGNPPLTISTAWEIGPLPMTGTVAIPS